METKTIIIERTFNAPVERVWSAWTEPEEIKKWWGPEHFTCPVAEIDLREGGKFLYCMRGAMGPGLPEQDFWSGGTFKEIVPMQKIVAMDHFADAEGNYVNASAVGMPGEWPDEMLVTTTFEDLGGKTKVTIVHEGHPPEMAGNAELGWNSQLDKFAAIVG